MHQDAQRDTKFFFLRESLCVLVHLCGPKKNLFLTFAP